MDKYVVPHFIRRNKNNIKMGLSVSSSKETEYL
jgi:hypothetical protein